MRASPAVVIAVLSWGACGGAPAANRPEPLRWTDRAFGEQHAASHERLVLPFTLDPQGTNGTAVILHLLRAAQARGARYVSDVAISIQFRRGDTPIECVSRVILRAAPAPGAASPDPAPGSVAPLEVEARVIDRELRCQKQQALVVTPGAGLAEQFEGDIGPYDRRAGLTSARGRVEWQDACELQPAGPDRGADQRPVRRGGRR